MTAQTTEQLDFPGIQTALTKTLNTYATNGTLEDFLNHINTLDKNHPLINSSFFQKATLEALSKCDLQKAYKIINESFKDRTNTKHLMQNGIHRYNFSLEKFTLSTEKLKNPNITAFTLPTLINANQSHESLDLLSSLPSIEISLNKLSQENLSDEDTTKIGNNLLKKLKDASPEAQKTEAFKNCLEFAKDPSDINNLTIDINKIQKKT
ncbi:MAG: hypothetical protein V4489_06210 [Chlamydiota bacterium]